MERQKQWQFYLIIAVIVLTIYNILPTIFYYTKPLKNPIDEPRANKITESIIHRVNALEKDSKDWLQSFCKLVKVKPQQILLDSKQPQFIHLTFKSLEDASVFRKYLNRAGSLIPFVPAQLILHEQGENSSLNKVVTVQRRIPLHFDPVQISTFFQFSPKFNEQGAMTELYKALVTDRALQIGISIGGVSINAEHLQTLSNYADLDNLQTQDLIVHLTQNLLSFAKTFGESSTITERYFSHFVQTDVQDKKNLIANFISIVQQLKDKLKLERIALQQESETLKTQGTFLETLKQQRLELVTDREKTLTDGEVLLNRHSQAFTKAMSPWTYSTLGGLLQETSLKMNSASNIQIVPLQGRNPFIDQISIDWKNEKIYIQLYPDIVAYRNKLETNKKYLSLKDQVDQWIYNEIAKLSRESTEEIKPSENNFVIELSQLTNSNSFLAMRLSSIAEAEINQIKQSIYSLWAPKHPDLQMDVFPIWDYDTYVNLPLEQKKLGLLVFSPAINSKTPPKGFHMNSVYVIAKGLDNIFQKARLSPDSQSSKLFFEDFSHLKEILQKSGLFGYPGSSHQFSPEYSKDFIFEGEDYYHTVLKATRENFAVHGTKRYAVLEFTDVEQRILTENKIDNRMHEDLLKWRDDFRAAQLRLKGSSPFDIPAPTKNVLWDNFKLSFIKYFRGDDRKILHWGLDLSGGKTVQIELRDHNNRIVTNEVDLKQGINELYNRVNKMGASEVSIRQEGTYITLDFPGSQGLSALELVKASSMFFHVVNEKFSLGNTALEEPLNHFLQDVWNEAVVTNRKDIEEINLIAVRHLYGDSMDPDLAQPRSESAKILYNSGLRLSNPLNSVGNNAFNDAISKISLWRGDDFTDWHGQTHPLLIVFRNYALEGANLDNVHAAYDPSKGNFLGFGVKSSASTKEGSKISPRDDLFTWTSQFSKEKIAGTPLENFTRGKGWRMAVILNGTVISAPTLDSPLRDSAMITGSFTQREVNQLEADLKAGSLSFTPHILSEKNVSPDLGAHERTLGILATVIALALVIGMMVGYYRFGGLVASVAVVFNLLIMWATLQNLQATLTLASIAGLILTLGMAVDANVLVFERIREEFKTTGRIASAVHAGYKKAFSAIIDSNLTTVIAALILLNFDSGPIKFFAITLIIGILSSMFTALFMTRFFFAGWVQNPKNKQLNMANWVKARHFDFLKHTRLTLILSTVIILIGGYLFIAQRHTIMGMDFTGGYAVNIELKSEGKANYRSLVENALVTQGATLQDFQIRELNPSNHIRLFLSRSLEQPGRPFYNLPLQYETKDVGYPYENNPKLMWIVQALEASHISMTSQALEKLDKNWSEVSGQMSTSMRNNAVIGLCLALLCILIYITFRFEFKYAISATICLAHDVVFTVAAMAILHFLKVPLQIDLNTVAALMTIIGYSLNDTIIVFDRIREDVRQMRKSPFNEIINHALNVTLSRTLMTSGTTLLVLIPLVALGGSTIFGFALVMGIGVIFGTLSSLFIAAPLMQYFHKREKIKNGTLVLNGNHG